MTLEQLVDGTPDLPTLPAAALAVIQETDSATATGRSIASHLAKDQALAARVLRLANSAYYGLTRQVSDIQEAVVVLGLRAVRNLAVVASSYPWMSKPFPGYGLGPMQLWKHSFATAVSARTVAQKYGSVDPDTVFTAGLVHNLGKSVFGSHLEGRGPAFINAVKKGQCTFSTIEAQYFGHDHAAVGGHLAERWNLPKALIYGIRFHHSPDEANDFQQLVDCVHVGDNLSFALDIGLEEDGMIHALSENSLQRLGIVPDDYEALVAACLEAYRENEQFYGLDSAGKRAA